jgi:hypothetical protein
VDNRAGNNSPLPQLVSWQLGMIFENTTPAPTPLEHGTPVTNNIPPGIIRQYVVDVPPWARFATNWLISASQPVNMLFNQNGPAVPPFAVTLLSASTNGQATLSASSGSPVLQPGERYYLGIQNTSTNPASIVLEVNFDVTPLTNRVPVTSTIDIGNLPRYFSYNVSSNSDQVTFQLLSLSGDVDLVARLGLPFPDPTSYDYGSFNAGTNDEEILVTTNSDPVVLTPGMWFLGVFNNDTTNVTYTILATENILTPTNPPGTNVDIIDVDWTTNSLCLTWNSEIGSTYWVEGKPSVIDTNWNVVSPFIVATNTTTQYCITIPSVNDDETTNLFFRVMLGLNPPSGPTIDRITKTPTGVLLEWTAPPTAQFAVEYATSLSPPDWKQLAGPITSTTGNFSYLDDGTVTGPGPVFYRLRQLP